MTDRSTLLKFAADNYALAQTIASDPLVATAEAERVHERTRQADRRRDHIASTARDMIKVAAQIVADGRGPTYTLDHEISGKVTMGCSLLLSSNEGYVPLYSEH